MPKDGGTTKLWKQPQKNFPAHPPPKIVPLMEPTLDSRLNRLLKGAAVASALMLPLLLLVLLVLLACYLMMLQ